MTIAEVRQQYPEYDHLTDEELSNSVYDTFYKDSVLTREDFDAQFTGLVERPSPTETTAGTVALAPEALATPPVQPAQPTPAPQPFEPSFKAAPVEAPPADIPAPPTEPVADTRALFSEEQFDPTEMIARSVGEAEDLQKLEAAGVLTKGQKTNLRRREAFLKFAQKDSFEATVSLANHLARETGNGFFNTLSGMAAGTEWVFNAVGAEENAETFEGIADSLSRKAGEVRAPIYGAEGFEQESTFVDQMFNAAGSQIVFMGPSLAIRAGGAGAAKAFGPKLAKAFRWGADGAAAASEALAEAGGVYEDLNRYVDEQGLRDVPGIEDRVSSVANMVFWSNLAVVGVTNKFGIFGDTAAGGAVMEGSQEIFQEVAPEFAKEREQFPHLSGAQLVERMVAAGTIGAVLGAPTQIAAGTLETVAGTTPGAKREARDALKATRDIDLDGSWNAKDETPETPPAEPAAPPPPGEEAAQTGRAGVATPEGLVEAIAGLPDPAEPVTPAAGVTPAEPVAAVVHTMPDGTVMEGPEHAGAVEGSERVVEVTPTESVVAEPAPPVAAEEAKETTTIYTPSGKAAEVEVVATSEQGTKIVKMPDGTEAIVGQEVFETNPQDPSHTIESAGFGLQGETVSELSDAELNDIKTELEKSEKERAAQRGTRTAWLRDTAAVSAESERRASEKKAAPVEPAPVAEAPAQPVGEAPAIAAEEGPALELTPPLTRPQKIAAAKESVESDIAVIQAPMSQVERLAAGSEEALNSMLAERAAAADRVALTLEAGDEIDILGDGVFDEVLEVTFDEEEGGNVIVIRDVDGVRGKVNPLNLISDVDPETKKDRIPKIKRVKPSEPRTATQEAPEAEPVAPETEVAAATEPVSEAPQPVETAAPYKLAEGEVVLSKTGRALAPFPKLDFTSERKTQNTIKRVDAWLRDEAIKEAESRGDEFNKRQFEAEDPKRMPPATKDGMNLYLFDNVDGPTAAQVETVKPVEEVADVGEKDKPGRPVRAGGAPEAGRVAGEADVAGGEQPGERAEPAQEEGAGGGTRQVRGERGSGAEQPPSGEGEPRGDIGRDEPDGGPSDAAARDEDDAEPEGSPPTVGGEGAKRKRSNDRNYRITPGFDLVPAPGAVGRVKTNIKAIETLVSLREGDKAPTEKQMKAMSQFTGWGAVAAEMFEPKFEEALERQSYREPSNLENPPNWIISEELLPKYQKWLERYGKPLHPAAGGMLTTEEWASARRSTPNAHYTSREIIEAMWKAAEHFGFDGGIVLEPAAGVGHFIGLSPSSVQKTAAFKAVELDLITGELLSKLYPDADVQVSGYEEAKRLGDNSVDLVITNVPFGNYKIFDSKRKDISKWSIHDYFLARAVDNVRPGGLVMAVTSRYSIDKGSAAMRNRIREKADLVGAIRLPDNAFKKNAGTEVVTDILIFRKKSDVPTGIDNPFRSIVPIETASGDLYNINEYFANNPEMVMGTHTNTGSMYKGDGYTVVAKPDTDLGQEIDKALGALPGDIMGEGAVVVAPERISAEDTEGAKEGALIEKNGTFYVVEEGELAPTSWTKTAAAVKRAKGYVKVRHEVLSLLDLMRQDDATEEALKQGRAALNKHYDAFVKRFGNINMQANTKYLADDIQFPLVAAVENITFTTEEKVIKGETKSVQVPHFEKADIFTKRTIHPFHAPSAADGMSDALNISMIYEGGINTAYIADLTNTSLEEARADLLESHLAFVDPTTGRLVERSEYLSGNVKEKLAQAKEGGAEYKDNVTALEKIQPEDRTMDRIHAPLGSTWIPEGFIREFVNDTLGIDAEVTFVKVNVGDSGRDSKSSWKVRSQSAARYGAKNQEVWGGDGFSGLDLVKAALNLKQMKISRKDSNGNNIQMPQATLIANSKLKELQGIFREWTLSNTRVSKDLAKRYNEERNHTVQREWPVPEITQYPGQSGIITPRDHQKRGVFRALRESVLLAHGVGTGKTWELTTIGMEMKRTGLASKPLIVVHNATTGQFAAAARAFYPGANILAPDAQSRKTQNRKRLLGQISTGDWDLIILPQSFFNGISVSPDIEEAFINEQITEIEIAIRARRAEEGKKDPTVKELEKILSNKEARLKALADVVRDNEIWFDQLGVDALLVDEAHEYKRSEFHTKLTNTKGIDGKTAIKSFHFMMKVREVQKKTGNRNIVLATGTPISNTTAELWVLIRYLRPDLLQKYGVQTFDDFATTFGDYTHGIEPTATGGFKEVTRFNRYANITELLTMWRETADVVLNEDVKIPGVPKMKTGNFIQVTLERPPVVAQAITWLKRVMQEWNDLSNKREFPHIPMRVQNLARDVALDLRLVNSDWDDHPGSKVNAVVDKAFGIYEEFDSEKGVQLIMAERMNDPSKSFNLFQDIKDKLIDKGVPAHEILSANEITDKGKEAVYDRVRAGQIRFVMGTTAKFGVGVDVARRLKALHHLDAPYRPMDIEQRNGRILRQGNLFKEAEIYVYGMKNTLDAVLFDTLVKKQKFINQLLRGDIVGDSMEDPTDDTQLSYQEMVAAFADNPLVMEKFTLAMRLRELAALKAGEDRKRFQLMNKLERVRDTQIPSAKKSLKINEANANKALEVMPEGKVVSGVIDGKALKRKELNTAITGALDTSYEALDTKWSKAKNAALIKSKSEDADRHTEVRFKLNGYRVVIDIRAVLKTNDETGLPQYDHVKMTMRVRDDADNIIIGGMGDVDLASTKGVFSKFEHAIASVIESPKRAQELLTRLEGEKETIREELKKTSKVDTETAQAAARLDEVEEKLKAFVDQDTAGEKEAPLLGAPDLFGGAGSDFETSKVTLARRKDPQLLLTAANGKPIEIKLDAPAPEVSVNNLNLKTPDDYEPPIEGVRGMALPEIVALAYDLLGGKYPKISKYIKQGRALGVFRAAEGDAEGLEIRIAARSLSEKEEGQVELLFEDPEKAAYVVAHELGHLIDFLPDLTRNKGNILGRIQVVNKNLKKWADSVPTSTGMSRVLPEREKRRITGAARKAVVERKGLKLKDYANSEELRAELKGEIAEERTKLMAAAAEERFLVSRDVVTEELKKLSKSIKPFDENADEKYTAYRFKPSELFADMISVLINDPQKLKDEAPQTWRSLFAYLVARPNVLQAYRDVQAKLHDPKMVVANRYARAINDMGRGHALQAEAERMAVAKDRSIRNIWSWVERAFIDTNSPFLRIDKALKAAGKWDPETSIRYAWEEVAYAESFARAYVGDIQSKVILPLQNAGVEELLDLSLVLLSNRIINERKNVANPWGITPAEAAEFLQWIQAKYSPEQFDALITAASNFWAIRQDHILRILDESGLLTDRLRDFIFENPYYVTFKPIGFLEKTLGAPAKVYTETYEKVDAFGKRARKVRFDQRAAGASRGSTKFHEKVGTFQAIADPLTETMLRDIALLRGALTNKALSDTVRGMRTLLGPAAVPPARRGRGGVFLQPKDKSLGLFTFRTRGKLVGYYVPAEMVKALEKQPEAIRQTSRALSYLLLNPLFRELFVGRNPGFWSFNVQKDIMRGAKNMPNITWMDKWLPYWTGAKLFGHWLRAVPRAFNDEVLGLPDDIVEGMYGRGELISMESRAGMSVDEGPIGIERSILRKGVTGRPGSWKWFFNPLKWHKAINHLWDVMGKLGSALEKSTKIAGRTYLDKAVEQGKIDLSDREISHIVRTQIGSPDFMRRGLLTPVTNQVYLFSNPTKEGWRGDAEVMKERPVEYLWKTIWYTLIPKTLTWGMKFGLPLGVAATLTPWFDDEDDRKEVMDGVSDYNLVNYNIVPLGLTESGKSIYLRIPMDETGRTIAGVYWKLLAENLDPDDESAWEQVFSFMGGQAPSLAPMLSIMSDVYDYATNQNPYDEFHQRYAIPPEMWLAAQSGDPDALWRLRARFGKHIWDMAGGRVAYRFKGDNVEDVTGELEEIYDSFTATPVLGNVLARYLVVSDYGNKEKIAKTIQKTQAVQAAWRQGLRQVYTETLNENKGMSGEVLAAEVIRRVSDNGDLMRLLTGEGDPLLKKSLAGRARRSVKRIQENISRWQMRQLSGPVANYADAIANNGDPAVRAALLFEANQDLTAENYTKLFAHAIAHKYYSDSVQAIMADLEKKKTKE